MKKNSFGLLWPKLRAMTNAAASLLGSTKDEHPLDHARPRVWRDLGDMRRDPVLVYKLEKIFVRVETDVASSEDKSNIS